MKKILLIVLSLAMAVSISGCAGTGGSGLEGVETSSAADISKIKASSYSNDLKGLEEYLVDIKYIPKSCTPTEMMYKVIGAEKGDRYYYTVNDSAVFVELYEYDTKLYSMTRGSGVFSYEFARYEQAPDDVAKKEIEANKQ